MMVRPTCSSTKTIIGGVQSTKLCTKLHLPFLSCFFAQYRTSLSSPSWTLPDEEDCSTGKGITSGRTSLKQMAGANFAVQPGFEPVISHFAVPSPPHKYPQSHTYNFCIYGLPWEDGSPTGQTIVACPNLI